MKVVIIGGGTAGVNVATHLRRLDEDAEIVILEKSDEFAIATCGLSYYLSGEVNNREDLMGASVEEMQHIFKVEVKLSHEVNTINREEKKLIIDGKPDENYDKLVIATGAMQLRPDIEGILGDNIFTIHSLKSVERIKDYFHGMGVKNISILGGGYIGVEMAESFHKLGAKVTIIEEKSHILANFDTDIVSGLEKHLQESGVKIHINSRVKSFGENKINLENGKKINYDMAIIATGVKPDVKLPIMADLEIGESGGLKVNKHMQTNDEDIYAIGDNVEVISLITKRPVRINSAEIAIKQARIAAENLAGKKAEFEPVLGTFLTHVFGQMAMAIGANEETLKKYKIAYHKIHLFTGNKAAYLKDYSTMLLKLLFSNDGKILGAQGVGKDGVDKRLNVIATLVQNGGKVNDLLKAEIAYSPAYATAKDGVNSLGSIAQSVIDNKIRYVYVEDFDWGNLPKDVIFVDVRSPKSFKAGHLPAAINFPLETIRSNLGNIPRDKKIVLYCNRGYGAYNAYCILSQRGFDNVFLLSGSMDLYTQIV